MTRGLRVVVFQCGCQAWPGRSYRSGLWWVVGGLLGVPGFGGWLRVVGWLWVENCIVDASILFSVVYSCLWLSCQGRTVDALAPGADEGRGRPR
jgi:hypothetical protein